MGTAVGGANNPIKASSAEQSLIRNTVSLAWRIGKAIMVANKSSQISRIGDIIIDAIGGPSTGKVLFAGKITEVRRTLYRGHTVGEVHIAATPREEEDAENPAQHFEGTFKIVSRLPFPSVSDRD